MSVASESSPADLSTSAIGGGARPAITQPIGRFASGSAGRFDGLMKIIEHRESFEVRSDDGSIVRQFAFDENASRRAISSAMTKKRALQEAQTFAGKGAVLMPRFKKT